MSPAGDGVNPDPDKSGRVGAAPARPTCILVGNEVLARRNALVGKIEAVGLEVRQVVDPGRAADLDASTVDVVVFQVDGTKHTHTEGVRRMASRGGRRLITINHQRSSGSWQKLVEFVAERAAVVPCSLSGPARPEERGVRPEERGIDYEAVLTAPRPVVEPLGAGDVGALRRQLREVDEDVAQLREQLRGFEADLLAAAHSEAEARSDLGKARRALEAAKLEVGKLEEAVALLQEKNGALVDDNATAGQDLARARAQLVESEAKRRALEALDAATEEATAPALDPSVVEALRTLARGEVMTWEEAFAKLAGRVVRS